jgi:hypothetical protein
MKIMAIKWTPWWEPLFENSAASIVVFPRIIAVERKGGQTQKALNFLYDSRENEKSDS